MTVISDSYTRRLGFFRLRHRMEKSKAVVGLQWGDEGKARVIDYLTERSDYVVRFQGGSNAGHTVVAEGRKFIFHLIPSGMLHRRVHCLIGPGVVLDPWGFREEVEKLEKDMPDIRSRLVVSSGCHLVLPYHRRLDALYESLKGDQKLGTTGRGIGPCYADRSLRHGIRLATLFHAEHLRSRLETILPIQNAILTRVGDGEPIDLEELYTSLLKIADWIRPMAGDVPNIISKNLKTGKRFLFEGAQSVMLDIDYGTYPYVTSSNSSLTGLYAGCGLHPGLIDEVWGVSKVYCTRVGEGPFPTELHGAEGEKMRELGGEYGATTGRPRRCGWLDLPALRYAIETSGITAIALTKMDVLNGYDTIRVCTGYRDCSHRVYHADPLAVASIDPVYTDLLGWKCDLAHVEKISDLPAKARKLIDLVESSLDIPVKLITVGASREQTILP